MSLIDWPGILKAIAVFDGKHTDVLLPFTEEQPLSAQDIDRLLTLIETEDVRGQIAGSWLILNMEQTDEAVRDSSIERMVAILHDERFHWQVVLQLLQLLDKHELSDNRCNALNPVLCGLIDHQKPFVRAWAFNLWIKVADRVPAYRIEVTKALEGIEGRETASVQARVRKAMKACDWC